MKKIFSLAISALIACVSVCCFAQDKRGNKEEENTATVAKQKMTKEEWQDRMKAEKIAYLTGYMNLTSEEAQKFWPVYNQAEEEKSKAFKNTIKAFKTLESVLNDGNGDSKIKDALDKYLSAQQQGNSIDKKYADKYRKILSEEKVAKLFLAEEKFRREQIHRWPKTQNHAAKTSSETQK